MPTKPEHTKKPQGKPTIEPDNHDENVGQREHSDATHGGVKPPAEHDKRGKNYGQREGSTVTEDNDVE
jgi:hypothetical protein